MRNKEPPRPGSQMRVSSIACPVCRPAARLLVLVLAAIPLVHWFAAADRPHADPKPAEAPHAATAPATTPAVSGPVTEKLPLHVVEMRDAILAAVASGRIEDLETAIDWNEMKPELGAAAGENAIAYLKKASADGEGREFLAILANVLALGPARLPIGNDPENNAVYVWPYLAEIPLDKLSPAQDVDLLRLMPAEAAKAMRDGKRWTWWRLTIGADGTWHTFLKHK